MRFVRPLLTRWLPVGLLLLVLFHVWIFWPVRLSLATLPPDLALPPAAPPAGLALYALPTGVLHSRALFAFRGGSPFEARDFGMNAYLIRHPRGDLLIDTGLGSQVATQYAQLPALLRMTTRYTAGMTAAAQLRAGGILPEQLAGVILTHAHWDHVSGLPDLAGARIWINAAESAFIDSGDRMSALAASFPSVARQTYAFEGGPYLGYPSSHDVFGDGAVVLVPAGGHTPGSVIVFVSLPDQRRYAFIGDIAWQLEGIERPAERPWPSRVLVDHNGADVREQLRHLAALHQRFPQLRLVPAHDLRAAESIPVWPATAQ